MIISESDGDLVLELVYKFLKITMDKFFKLMVPDLIPECPSGTPPSENEIRSPTLYLLRPNSRKFYQRKSLQFDTIMEMSENQIDLDVSSNNLTQDENASNTSFNKDLEEFKIDMIHQKTVHSSPKLVTSHFEDSGFLNYSIEMTSRLETISEIYLPQEDKSLGHEISFDSHLQGEGDHSHSWKLKVDENSPMNRHFIANSGDQSFGKYSTEYFSDASKPSNDKFITETMNVRDSSDPAHNQRTTITTDNVCENDPIAKKLSNIASIN